MYHPSTDFSTCGDPAARAAAVASRRSYRAFLRRRTWLVAIFERTPEERYAVVPASLLDYAVLANFDEKCLRLAHEKQEIAAVACYIPRSHTIACRLFPYALRPDMSPRYARKLWMLSLRYEKRYRVVHEAFSIASHKSGYLL